MKAQAIRYVLDQVVPQHLECPIRQGLMHDPATMPGDAHHVFERTAALAWLQKKRTNPLTRGEVPYGPLLQRPDLRQQAAHLLQEAGRFHRAFGSRREGAALTIQGAWLRYKAEQPAWKANKSALMDELKHAQTVAGLTQEALVPLATVLRLSRRCAQQARRVATQVDAAPNDAGESVDWAALGEAHGGWGIQLRMIIERPSVRAMTALHRACVDSKKDFAALMLDQNAAPLRAMLYVAGLPMLAACARWLPAGRHGSLQMPGPDASAEFYVGEVNAAGERHGFGLHRTNTTTVYGQWERGQLNGLGVHQEGESVVSKGQFLSGQRDCVVIQQGETNIAGKMVGGDLWGNSTMPEGTASGTLTGPGLSRLELTTDRSTTDFCRTDDLTLGRIRYHSGYVYHGQVAPNTGLAHGPGELTLTSGERLAAVWNKSRPTGVGLLQSDACTTLRAYDAEGEEALRGATP